MNYIQKRKAEHREHFFSDDYLNKNIKISKHISVVAVVHIIDTGIPYIKTLDKYFSLEYIIPKPKSINKKLLKYFPKKKILNLTRDGINNTDDFLSKLNKIPKNNKIILLDIGGYFSQIGNRIKKRFGNKFIGIIEDTENGHKRYLNQKLEYPVISVARSLLKKNEDYLVGQAVVFSAEALLREQGILINSKEVGIIGIGKIGNGILSSLKSKSSQISIFDNNPINLIISYSMGGKIVDKLSVIQNSEILFLATGNLSLKNDEFKYLKTGAFVISVTSSDDEIDLSWLENNYNKKIVSKYIIKYNKKKHHFFIINNGNAVNFIHGAVIDDFILLVQKEMIDSIVKFSKTTMSNEVHKGFNDTKLRIADSWLKKILNLNI